MRVDDEKRAGRRKRTCSEYAKRGQRRRLLTVSGTKPSDSSPILNIDSSESILLVFGGGEKNLT
jgi:hypothetical protein